jgi:hypothetical protein
MHFAGGPVDGVEMLMRMTQRIHQAVDLFVQQRIGLGHDLGEPEGGASFIAMAARGRPTVACASSICLRRSVSRVAVMP